MKSFLENKIYAKQFFLRTVNISLKLRLLTLIFEKTLMSDFFKVYLQKFEQRVNEKNLVFLKAKVLMLSLQEPKFLSGHNILRQ